MSNRLIHIRFITVLLVVFFSLIGQSIYAQRYSRYNNNRIFNIGARFGLNSLAINNYNAYLNETELPNSSYVNRSGCDLNIFFRLNFVRVFLQPEIGWGLYNQKLHFSLPTGEDSWRSTNLDVRTQTSNANALIGYNIVKDGPFLLSAIVGPSFQYNFNSKYTVNSPNSKFTNKTPNYNTFGIVGITVNITKVHFDIRYGISLLDTNINFNNISESIDTFKDVSIRKNENFLSFSCGLMF